MRVLGGAFPACLSSCPLVLRWAGLRGFRTCRSWLWSSGRVFPPFLYSLLLCARCVACKYGSISRFKAVFSAVWWFRVGLLGLGALRGLCGFCTRVELGGLETCGVFALVFPLFALLLFFCPAFVACFLGWLPALLALLLSWLCGLVFGVGWVVVSFSLSDGFRHKKKGRKVFASSLVLL